MSFASVCDTVVSFIRKFFSLIIALLIALMTLLFVIGAGRVITLEKNFGKAGFAHFLAIIFSIVTAICYVALHFVPRKAYRLLYALTFLLLCTMFLVAHSMGLSGPVVSDCTTLGALSADALRNYTWNDLGHIGMKEDSDGDNITIGTLGEPVRHCDVQALLFASALLNLILYVVALFDVQGVLLSRVKSKTYGERFVEMGISS